MISSVTRSATRPRTGRHSASNSHHAPTNRTVTTPPVRCTENTPSSASTASGMRSRCRIAEMTSTVVGTARPKAARLGIDAVSNSTYGIAVNDADIAADAAAAPAVRHSSVRVRSHCHVRVAALTGNNQTAAATELSVYAVVGAAPVTRLRTVASA